VSPADFPQTLTVPLIMKPHIVGKAIIEATNTRVAPILSLPTLVPFIKNRAVNALSNNYDGGY